MKVSLATVYNTLHQFTEAGLLRQVIVDAARSYFDTNTGDHQHFFLRRRRHADRHSRRQPSRSPAFPRRRAGLAVDRVDVVVRVQARLTAACESFS